MAEKICAVCSDFFALTRLKDVPANEQGLKAKRKIVFMCLLEAVVVEDLQRPFFEILTRLFGRLIIRITPAFVRKLHFSKTDSEKGQFQAK